ncbi:MAG: carboxylating nicotinate-nucleotide diphosphorylase [Pirellulaceae bacterium]
MPKEYHQCTWDAPLIDDLQYLIDLAVREDLGRQMDWSTVSLIPEEAAGAAAIVARQSGILAGAPCLPLIIQYLELDLTWTGLLEDGARLDAGTVVGTIAGSVRDLLTCERIILNFLGRLSGVATLTDRYVQAITETSAAVYDTRKTTPGWRRLEKYAVRCGGGTNHRGGLYEAVMLKDNHLAWYQQSASANAKLQDLVPIVRKFLIEHLGESEGNSRIIEVEVDTLDQLRDVLASGPDIVLLDNMHPRTLAEAVIVRDAVNPDVPLEASGGVTLDTIQEIAVSGVDRISVGAITHSAVSLDLGLDWKTNEG